MFEQLAASRAVEVAERRADGHASEVELERAHHKLDRHGWGMAHVASAADPMRLICLHLLGSVEEMVRDRGSGPPCFPPHCPLPWRDEYVLILEEMLGPLLWASVTVDPVWLA